MMKPDHDEQNWAREKKAAQIAKDRGTIHVPDIPGPVGKCWKQGPLMHRCRYDTGHDGPHEWEFPSKHAIVDEVCRNPRQSDFDGSAVDTGMTPTAPDRVEAIKAALACPTCLDTGGVTEVYPEHDPSCDGSCRNCPVGVPYQAPCPNCNDGDAPAPLSWEQSRWLVAEVTRLRIALEIGGQEANELRTENAALRRRFADMEARRNALFEEATALRQRHAEAVVKAVKFGFGFCASNADREVEFYELEAEAVAAWLAAEAKKGLT